MAKNVKKSKKNKAIKSEQAKLASAHEAIAEAVNAKSEEIIPQKTAAPVEAKAPVVEETTPVEAPAKVEASENNTEPKTEAKHEAKVEAKVAAKKSTVKKPEVKKAGRKPMTAEEKAASAKARAGEKKKAEAMAPTLTLQYGGRDVDVRALVQAAKDDFKANHKRVLLTELNLYLKPEDGALYYVANGSVQGKIQF